MNVQDDVEALISEQRVLVKEATDELRRLKRVKRSHPDKLAEGTELFLTRIFDKLHRENKWTDAATASSKNNQGDGLSEPTPLLTLAEIRKVIETDLHGAPEWYEFNQSAKYGQECTYTILTYLWGPRRKRVCYAFALDHYSHGCGNWQNGYISEDSHFNLDKSPPAEWLMNQDDTIEAQDPIFDKQGAEFVEELQYSPSILWPMQLLFMGDLRDTCRTVFSKYVHEHHHDENEDDADSSDAVSESNSE